MKKIKRIVNDPKLSYKYAKSLLKGKNKKRIKK
jgi:hypothetical protein